MLENILIELQKIWDSFIDQLPSIIIAALLLLFFILIGSLIKRVFLNRFAKRIEDKLLSNFLGNLIMLIFIIIGTIFFLNEIGLGKAAAGLLAGAGVTAIILGFAFKDIGENLLAGIMMAFSRPFNIGDVLEISGFVGTVRDLSLRNTHLRTFNGRDIYIPNSTMIKSPLINFTKDGLLRHEFVIGLDYNEPVLEIIRLIDEALSEITEIVHAKDLEPFVIIDEFATSTINLKVHFWINSKDFVGSGLKQKSEVMRRVIYSLIAKGVSLPADIVEMKIYQEGKPIPISINKNLEI